MLCLARKRQTYPERKSHPVAQVKPQANPENTHTCPSKGCQTVKCLPEGSVAENTLIDLMLFVASGLSRHSIPTQHGSFGVSSFGWGELRHELVKWPCTWAMRVGWDNPKQTTRPSSGFPYRFRQLGISVGEAVGERHWNHF